ncbi:hypothetical protein CHGG_10011 [Chaetomium globosum CBS 148.51]|uniref:Gelsolin-like domain-containing protein n=1 Tax=Chaetomium globosum (strain ATCC 6205 / CBS 148.51 / DSM 1962 / NBRC 6347 / NRRL 1970) TaxID=306901 RepID=Q2GPU3_CHAGB|nr:uncharacterized protein CHGG_10011 [Chaetomium globosum CBS 148.51]EAQ83607.1 hypothetical protein CHGG_10011 [Chaetomium globosum CBS 148.51]
MAPHAGLVHLKEYDIKDRNVELIGSDLDHKFKHASASAEPDWNDGQVGLTPGLFVWRIENFAVVPVPPSSHGQFYDGDSYIILHSKQPKQFNLFSSSADAPTPPKLTHAIHFLLGAHTSQDEAGTAAYKTVELDAFLHGAATQHRELQAQPSASFLALFPRLTFRRGGVASGFRHVGDPDAAAADKQDEVVTLLRVFKNPCAVGSRDAVVVCEVEADWRSLDEGDVFVLEKGKGGKIWVWQGGRCSPMEKAKAAQVVHEMKLAKRVDVEVVSQAESRSRLVVTMLGGGEEDGFGVLKAPRPMDYLGLGGSGREQGGEGDVAQGRAGICAETSGRRLE